MTTSLFSPAATAPFNRRQWLGAAAAGVATLGLPCAWAQSDTIRILVGFAAGGSSDILARVIAPYLSRSLGKNVVVENKPGASGMLAIQEVESAAPNDPVFAFYPTTTMMGFVLQGQEPALHKLTVIAPMYEQFTVIAVNPTVPEFDKVKSLQDLVRLSRSLPRDIAYTTAAPGSISHLTCAKLCDLAGIRMQHIAHKGSQPALADFLAGNVPVAGLDPTVLSPHLKSPKVRALAVNYPKRVSFLPDVPSMVEAGFAELSSVTAWAHFVGPAGMPPEAVRRMHLAVQKAIHDPEVNRRIQQSNALPKSGNPETALATMQHDLKYWKQVILTSDIRAI